MRRFVAVALCAAAALVPAATAAQTPSANLRITVWPRGKEGPSLAWTLRCRPDRGTLPQRERACRTLASNPHPFRAVPKSAVCTQVFGGPQLARVRGTFRGRRISATFDRSNGCEITRWNRLRVLFPTRR